MFELITNLIVYGSLVGSAVVIVMAVISVCIKVVAVASVRNVTFPVPAAAKPTDVCLYCGYKLRDFKCGHCGGSNPQFAKVEV